jgi:hypothetical protein
MSDRELHDTLRTDPIAVAEQVTGVSYKEDEGTLGLGVLMHMSHGARKREMLEERDDTTFSNDLDRYLRIIGEEGFQKILELDFTKRETAEKFFVFYHFEDGILLSFDTYGGDSVNGGKFRYNIKPNGTTKDFAESQCTSSGGYTEHDGEMIWSGDHDCREALRHHIAMLRENGTFVKDWVKPPFLWLLHHGDIEGEYDYDAINAERIAMFPEEVQKAISG